MPQTPPDWSVAAWAAWRRHDPVAAVTAALDAAEGVSEQTPGTEDAVRLACYFAVRTSRVDLLVAHRRRIEALPPGVVRHAALVHLALGDPDLHQAMAIAAELRDSPHDLGRVTDEASDSALCAETLVNVATAALARGWWPHARTHAEEARRHLADARGVDTTQGPLPSWATSLHFDLLGIDAITEYETHAGDTARRALWEALDPLRRDNSLTTEHMLALIGMAQVQHLTGDLAAAAVTLNRVLGLSGSQRAGLAEHARIELTFIRVREGRWGDVDRLAAIPTATLHGIDRRWFAPQTAALDALVAALGPDQAAARRRIAEVEVMTERAPSVLAVSVLTHARLVLAAQEGDWVTLGHLVEDMVDPGYRLPYREEEWRIMRMAAAWTGGRTAEVEEGYADWAGLPGVQDDPYFHAFTAIRIEARDRDAARVAARRAVETLHPRMDPAGVAAIHAAVDDLLDPPATPRAAPATPRPSPDAHGPGDDATPPALTTQQRRIALAVAQGYTSAEIAVMMHLTKRTIDYHVQNILRRLGISSRREIGRHLRSLAHRGD